VDKIAVPAKRLFTLKLIEPLAGMVIDWGALTTDGVLLIRFKVSGVFIDGEIVAVSVPVEFGVRTS